MREGAWEWLPGVGAPNLEGAPHAGTYRSPERVVCGKQFLDFFAMPASEAVLTAVSTVGTVVAGGMMAAQLPVMYRVVSR